MVFFSVFSKADERLLLINTTNNQLQKTYLVKADLQEPSAYIIHHKTVKNITNKSLKSNNVADY